MAEWTHRICERCWFDGNPQIDYPPPGVLEDRVTYRAPTLIKNDDPGPCCVCGGMTITSIYFRERQDRLPCQGRHEPNEVHAWSRVGVQST